MKNSEELDDQSRHAATQQLYHAVGDARVYYCLVINPCFPHYVPSNAQCSVRSSKVSLQRDRSYFWVSVAQMISKVDSKSLVITGVLTQQYIAKQLLIIFYIESIYGIPVKGDPDPVKFLSRSSL